MRFKILILRRLKLCEGADPKFLCKNESQTKGMDPKGCQFNSKSYVKQLMKGGKKVIAQVEKW